MKKTARIVLCLVPIVLHGRADAGTTTIVSKPPLTERSILVEIECTMDMTVVGLCGVQVNPNLAPSAFDTSGLCTSNDEHTRYAPRHLAASPYSWIGCSPTAGTTGVKHVTIRGTVRVRLTTDKGLAELGPTMYVAGHVLSGYDRSNNTATIRITTPDGQTHVANLSGAGRTTTGPRVSIDKKTWTQMTGTETTIVVRYADYITLRNGQSAELMTTSAPMYMSATTDIADVAVTTADGVDLISGGATVATDELVITDRGKGAGVRSGNVIVNVSAK